jgi:hypothetical protein
LRLKAQFTEATVWRVTLASRHCPSEIVLSLIMAGQRPAQLSILAGKPSGKRAGDSDKCVLLGAKHPVDALKSYVLSPGNIGMRYVRRVAGGVTAAVNGSQTA